MYSARKHPEAPRPKAWPRRDRSAVIHTIALARTSVVHTRSWAANSINARIRLRAENERLRAEIELLREEGPDALVQPAKPVNRFPEFVSYIVLRLEVLCPTMGKGRIARVLCRAGLHLGSTTARRMLREPHPRESPAAASAKAGRTVTAHRPNHVLHTDLTTVPTSLGFWVSWLPFTLPQV